MAVPGWGGEVLYQRTMTLTSPPVGIKEPLPPPPPRSAASLPPTSSGTPRSPAQLPQAQLLHRALLAIGVEIDEEQAIVNPGHGDSAKPRSARQRFELRRCYVAHTDSEFAKLRAQVADREAVVAQLRSHVDKLEQAVQATRAAASRRAQRLRMAEAQAAESASGSLVITNLSSSGLTGLLNTKKRFMRSAGGVVYDAELTNGRARDPNARLEVDFQASVSQHMEEEHVMRASVEEHRRLLNQQTVHRKANEAGLFGKHTEVLQLRAQTLRTEARVTRLANDLRRVYRQVPQVVEQKLQQSTTQYADQAEKELGNLELEHRLEHLKWLSSSELADQISLCEGNVQEMTQRADEAERTLQHGAFVADALAGKVNTVRRALVSLNQAWSKLGELPSVLLMQSMGKDSFSKDGTSAAVDEVQSLLKEAELLAAIMAEAAACMHPHQGAAGAGAAGAAAAGERDRGIAAP